MQTCLVLGLVGVIIAGFLLYDLLTERTSRLSAARESAVEKAAEAARLTNQELKQIPPLAQELTADPGSLKLSPSDLKSHLAKVRQAHPILHDAGVTGEGLDAGWQEPSWQGSPPRLTARYVAPFARSGESEPAGAVYLDVSLDRLTERVEALDVGRTGWGLVVSKEGKILAHPADRLVRGLADIRQLVADEDDQATITAVENALRGESGLIERQSLLTGQSAWFVYEPVPETGWSVIVARIKDEVTRLDRSVLRRVILILTAAIFGFVLLGIWGAAMLCRRQLRRGVLWVLVAISSLLMIFGMAGIRRFGQAAAIDEESGDVQILDNNGLASFLDSQAADGAADHDRMVIPTGVLAQSVKFISAREIRATGYVWQRFADGIPADLALGVILPDASASSFAEAYRHRDDRGETVGWSFEAELRQDLDLSRFPFDQETLSLRLWPKEFEREVILAPDLGSFTLTNPAALPGLAENLDLGGWDIFGSYFSYHFPVMDSDLGISARKGRDNQPELHFNISIKRRLFDAAISYTLPMAIVVAMLFAVLVTTTRNEEESMVLGFNPSGVMRITSALFFVIVVAHIQLRSSLEAKEVVLLEYSYFTIYLTILLVSLHSFLFSLKKLHVWLVDYEDSLILKLVFWPGIFSVQYAVTALVFY